MLPVGTILFKKRRFSKYIEGSGSYKRFLVSPQTFELWTDMLLDTSTLWDRVVSY